MTIIDHHASQTAQQATSPLVVWQPDSRGNIPRTDAPPMLTAMRRGAGGHCPECGQGRLFAGWLRVNDVCTVCAAPLGDIRADDAPPYFTVFIVAHVVIGAQVALERNISLSVATEMMIFLPGTLLLTLALIRPVKGATVGMMMKLGFMKPAEAPESPNEASEKTSMMHSPGDVPPSSPLPQSPKSSSPSSPSLKSVVLNGETRQLSALQQADQDQAVRDLAVANVFAPKNHSGPFILHLSIDQGRLVFDIRDADDVGLMGLGLALGPFRRLLKDYQMLVDSYAHAVQDGREASIQAIDMGRRGLHNEGAELMMARLEGKVEIDFETARRLFTLVCVLHQRI